MNIWIMNHYAGNTYFDEGGRHYWFAKYLKRTGHAPTVFCCNAMHGKAENYFELNGVWQEKTRQKINVPYVFVKSRTYAGNGKQRILNMADFYFNLKKTAVEYAKLNGKPDVIVASSVHPLTLVAGIKTAKRFGIKCICEVRDLWPESIVAYSKKLTKNSPLIKLLYMGEKWIYKKADSLIFTVKGTYDYIVERGWTKDIPKEKVNYINNGVDLEDFEYNKENHKIWDEDLESESLFKVVYTGSIRRVNNLGLLLDAAKEVKDKRIKFLVWGDGDEREALEKRVKEENIENVVFKGKAAKRCVPYIVSRADLNFAHNEPSPVFRFGISFNKIFEYLAAGKPVLCDFPCPYNPVIMGGAGVGVAEPTPENIATVIEGFAAMGDEARREMSICAQKAAEEYSFKNLTDKLVAIINETVK